MKATIGLAIPENAMLTIELRCTVGEARKLRSQLEKDWPSYAFGNMLTKAIESAEAHFSATQEIGQ